MNEHILGFPKAKAGNLLPNGFTTDLQLAYWMFADGFLEVRERTSELELSSDWLQLIPYIIFKWNGKYLSYTRGKAGAELRLTNKKSMCIGGHLQKEDGNDSATAIHNGIKREIEEELNIEYRNKPKFLGILFDDSDSVGKSHIALITEINATSGNISSKDKAVRDVKWQTKQQLIENKSQYENWSSILIDSFWRKK